MEGMRFSSRPAGLQSLGRALRAAVPFALLAGLVAHVGTDPFARSLDVLEPAPVLAALLLGGLTTVSQAMRWRAVAAACGAASGLTRARAVRECYRSALLNAVLPGGVMGDAIRAWRHRGPRERGLRTSATAVVGERTAGTAVLLTTVALVTFPVDRRVAGLFLLGALAAAAVSAPSLRRLPLAGQLAVWGWSVLALAPLVGLFAVATAQLGTVPAPQAAVSLGLVVLAGMAIPIGVGGFGPREAVAALAFGHVGLSADAGVATAAAYGVLAGVSALPGVLVMLVDVGRDRRAERPHATATATAQAPAAPEPALTAPAAPVPAQALAVDVRVPSDARELLLDLVPAR
jgi:uncharacterized membrane protein YbhN (UPF0104 family)